MPKRTGNTNVADTIYDDLLEKILSDEIPAGTRLPSERELADTYSTNRNTLREAVRKLEHGRLVRVRHGQGVTVNDFRRTGTVDSLGPFLAHATRPRERIRALGDLLMARARVLEMSVALAATRADTGDIELIRELTHAQKANFHARDNEALVATDLRLLNAIIDASHSLTVRWIANTLIEIYTGLLDRMPSLWVYHDDFTAYMDTLADGMGSRDPDTVVDATRAYYQAVDNQLIDVLNSLVPQSS